MNLLGLFRSRDKPGGRPSPQNAVSAAPAFYFGSSGAGKSVTARSAIQVSAVYACVRVIAETIASLPLHVYENTDSGSVKAQGHPLYRLLHDEPNAEMSSFVMREVMLSHLLLWGNSYSQIIRSGRNHVVGLYPLLPDRMEVDRNSAGTLTYIYTTTEGRTVRLAPEEVLHIPGLGFDGVIGYSPIALEKSAIGLGIAAEEYGSKFFANGATPAGVLTHPNTVKNPKALRESWNAAYGGSANANRVAILEEGLRFERISMPNNEAQFLETRKFQVSEICRIFRVPPHLVGDLEHATFSNIEHQSISFGVHTIRPWLVRIEQSMNRALFSDKEKGRFYVRINMDGLMRGAYKERMEGYAIARQNGWMSANDIRDLENLNPLSDADGGNAYLVNGNMILITTAEMGGKANPAPSSGRKPKEDTK
jgi:HK97 family phage portal protein